MLAIGAAITLALATAIAAAADRARPDRKACAACRERWLCRAWRSDRAWRAVAVRRRARRRLGRRLERGLCACRALWTYAARFAAAGVQPIEAGLARGLERVCEPPQRRLAPSPGGDLLRIDLPIAAPSLAAAAFFFLSRSSRNSPPPSSCAPSISIRWQCERYAYASDERMHEAAAPALLIFAAGLLPMLKFRAACKRCRRSAF